MDQIFKVGMVLLMGFVFGAVYYYGFQVMNVPVLQPSYDAYVTTSYSVTPSPSPTVSLSAVDQQSLMREQEARYEAAAQAATAKTVKNDTYRYAVEMVVILLGILFALSIYRQYSLLAAAVLVGLIIGHLAFRGTITYDSSLSLYSYDPEQFETNQIATAWKLVAAAVASIVLVVIDRLKIEPRN